MAKMDQLSNWDKWSQEEKDLLILQRTLSPYVGDEGAVSYTHIDVYKRQVSPCKDGSPTAVQAHPAFPHPNRTAFSRLQADSGRVQRYPLLSRRTPVPVSYTHLDVYKRQFMYLSP